MTWIEFGWVRLRCPISEAAWAASRRTVVPPSRPATQARERASRLSSCSRATLTCSIRLPCGDELVEGGGVARAAHRLAQRLVGEHLRQLRQDLQVLLGGFLGHEQHEHQGDGRAVGRVEGHRLREAHECAQRFLESLDASVRNRHALPEAGRAELLAREQAVEHHASRDAIEILEQKAGLLEQPLLARGLQIDGDMRSRQYFSNQAHVRLSYSLSLYFSTWRSSLSARRSIAAYRSSSSLSQCRSLPRTCSVTSAFWRSLSAVRMTCASITWSKWRFTRAILDST